jgi:energy-coupling factor transporter ATP-binding protein EcfA2
MQFVGFQVTNYRNILDSKRIEANRITAFVGQNESGKSNLFDALYRVNPFDKLAVYSLEEDWPVDRWEEKDPEAHATVCRAEFALTEGEIKDLFAQATKPVAPAAAPAAAEGEVPAAPPAPVPPPIPKQLILVGLGSYGEPSSFVVEDADAINSLDAAKVNAWGKTNAPKFVYIHDVELTGNTIELDHLKTRKDSVPWDQLTNDEQTVSIILDLAKIDLTDWLAKGQDKAGRTTRAFDKRQASAYLSRQFQDLWLQKDVAFEIDIDATTLNIFAADKNVGMPVRLSRRSTGFRWHVSFAWKFTHASNGQYKNCILLLEEPGIHLHYSAQRDLLRVFERLKDSNTILYTTHLASMVDLGYPERVRIVEADGHHAVVKAGVVSSQKAPMAVIEMCLGLTGNMTGLLSNRRTLIVEGGDDALLINKLSTVLRASSKEGLSDSIYLWPAQGAPKTPMYAAFAIGQGWDSGVLLDSDRAGNDAKKKIEELYLKDLAKEQQQKFRVFQIGTAAKVKKTDAAIEELFTDEYYLEMVNAAYGLQIELKELPVDGSDMITKRIEAVLKAKYRYEFDKSRVVAQMLRRFDGWREAKDLPPGTAEKAEQLFKTINATFGVNVK